MNSQRKSYIKKSVIPGLALSAATGVATGGIVVLYRIAAYAAIESSEHIYEWLNKNFVFVAPVILLLAGLSVIAARLIKELPDICGGGIPTSIGVLRGVLRTDWLKSLIGVIFASLTTFITGVPLGNEGPCVQIGTAIGDGTVKTLAKKQRAWDRYIMTGGACAGFSAASGAPICGVLFALEEAHHRLSPMILLFSFVSVAFSYATLITLAPIFNISPLLFPEVGKMLFKLDLNDMWIPLLISIVIGLFAVIFLKFYVFVDKLIEKRLSHVSQAAKEFAIFVVTLIFGLISFDFISTGHHLALSVIDREFPLLLLAALLLFRCIVSLSASRFGMTGGLFLPIVSIGALVSAILAEILIATGLLTEKFFPLIVVFGIVACISGMMKIPLCAIVFAVEALGCGENILPIIILGAVPYLITEIFKVESINDSILEDYIHELNGSTSLNVIDCYVKVMPGSFVVGKQIRDILWPSGLSVLAIKEAELSKPIINEHGDKAMNSGDELHIRFAYRNRNDAYTELIALIGAQEIAAMDAFELRSPHVQ